SWTTYHTTQCGHECILSVIDSTGQLAERAMYDPYGRVTVYAPDETLIGNAFQSGLPMSWKAHRVETEAPLVYMRNRHYSPGLGRFLSVDRIGVFTDAFNLGSGYAYGASNPILFVDPFGLQGSSYRLSVSTSDGISFWHEASAGSEGEFHISSPDGALFDARIKVPDESGTPDESGEPRRPVDIAPPITNDDSWWDYLKSVAWTAAGVAGGIAVNYCIDEMTGVGGGIYRAVSSLLAGDVWGALGELVSAVTPVPSLKFTEDSLESIRRAARGAPEHHLMTNKNRISTARGGPWTPRFEDMANRAGMTLDDAANRVRIPGHVGPHSEEYHAEVFNRLSRSTEGLSGDAYSQAFRAELEAIRTEAATPGSALNRPIVR
ncbi:MAG: AHH domain-containing protein, partial [Planctomycetota bacterium]